MNLKEIKTILEEIGEPKFRLNQIIKAVYQDGILDWAEISNIPKSLREKLSSVPILPFLQSEISRSSTGDTFKALLELVDGNFIETVLMQPDLESSDWSICLSSQAGCALGCSFCATGKNGFKRNLEVEEIIGQALFWKGFLRSNKLDGRLSHVVYMGMGEPFLNWANVSLSIAKLTDESLFGLGQRSISVSTAGLPEGIKKISEEWPQVNLALSLHSAIDGKRQRLMKVAKKYSLEELQSALEKYIEKTNRKVFLEYVMIADFNDQLEDADALVDFVKSFTKPFLFHINLIACNSGGGETGSPREQVRKFKGLLAKKGVSVTIRKSLGTDIAGACGQLAGKKKRS